MADSLIDDDLLQELVELDESAMPSLATIWTKPKTLTPRGGTATGAEVKRNATPISCRVTSGGGTGTPSVSVRTGGAVLQTVGLLSIAFAVSEMSAQSVTIDDDDEVDVTSKIPIAGADFDSSGRYKVVGPPLAGTYSTNLSVPAVRIK